MKEQSYSNHAAWFPLFHFVVLPFLLVYAVRAIWICFQVESMENAWGAAFAVVVFLGALASRLMALKVQDRLIRLEMRLRLASILPDDLKGHIANLTPTQLIGLRFACDEEMPGLVRQVVSGQLTDLKSIKKAVKNWQGDYLRA